MADGPSIGTAYLRIAGDFSQITSQAVAMFNSSKWSKLGKVAGVALGADITAAGAAKALYDIGAAFDEVNDKFRTQTGATGKELGKLENSFKKVVSTVPADFGAASDAVAGLNQRLDLTGKPLTELARQITALSKVTGTDVKDNVAAITRLFGDWSVKTDRQRGTLDKLYRLTQDTGIGFRDLSELMVQFGSPLRQLGFSFDESAVMFARFEKEGVNMQTLLPGLRYALKNIAVPSDELAKSFKQLGIDTRDPHDALLQLFDLMSSDKISEADQTLLASQVFGGRAWADMKAAIEEGRFEFDDLIKGMRRGKETITGSERSTRDLSEQWQLFTNRLKVFVEPIASRVFELVGDGMKALNRLDFGKAIAAMKEFWDKAGLLRDVVKAVVEVIKDRFGSMVDIVKGAVKLVSSILTGDFGAAWDAVKGIFKAGVRFALAPLKGAVSLFKNVAERIGDGLADGFDSAWDKIKGIFEGGRDALVDIINWIISNVINRIPGVELGTIGGSSGGGGRETGTGASPNAEHHFSGGKITAPMAIVGEEAPRHPEFVLATNPAYRKRNLSLWHQAGQMLGVPGFAQGGIHGANALGAATGAASALVNGPGRLISMLDDAPFDKLPGFLSGTGDYVKDKFADYIRDKVHDAADALTSGMTSSVYTGPPADAKRFADNNYVDSHTLAVTAYLDRKFGLTQSSGYRSPAHNAAIGGAPGSLHTHGSPDNPGATDSVGALGAMHAMIGFASQHIAGLQEAMVDNYAGLGYNAHIGFFKEGGVIGRPLPADLQKFNRIYAKHVSPDYSGETMPPDKIAKLAEFFGMPGIAMAQIAHGESAYRPGAVGDDAAAGYGNTFGYGLWQITTGASGMDSVVNRMGGYSMMLNPIANAIVAGKMYAARGVSPWFGTAYLTDPGRHWQGEMGELVSAAHPDRGSNGGDGGGRGRGAGPGHPVTPSGYEEGQITARAYKEARDLPKQIRDALALHQDAIDALDTQIGVSEVLDALSTSEAGSELGPTERAAEIALNDQLLANLEGMVPWLRKGLRANRVKSTTRERLQETLDTLLPTTSGVGRILDVRQKLDSLSGAGDLFTFDSGDLWKQKFEQQLATSQLYQSQMQALIRLANDLPKYHDGGIVGERPILARDGEGVFTPQQMAAMGGPAGIVIEDGAVDATRIRGITRDELNAAARRGKRIVWVPGDKTGVA